MLSFFSLSPLQSVGCRDIQQSFGFWNEGLFIKEIRIQFKMIQVVHRHVVQIVVFFLFHARSHQVIVSTFLFVQSFFWCLLFRNSNWIPAMFFNHSNRKDNRHFTRLIRKLKKAWLCAVAKVMLSKLRSWTRRSQTKTVEFSIYANGLDSSLPTFCTSCSLRWFKSLRSLL